MKFLILCALFAIASADFLSVEQAETLRETWNKIKHNEVDILYSIFKAYPDIQAKFPKFAGKDLDSIKGSADFALHATRIVSFISEVISLSGNKANAPAIETLVTKLGVEHKDRGVTKDQFNEFRTAITNYASSHATWGDNVAAVWNQALDNVYTIIFSQL
ncbi:hypothetical protein PVAND_014750 [Polypedilum vanderplanki]|uniref:Globin n=1 Tax=Polypedilum vanderplanki TaxID=319348 RepID=S6BTL8_POLVA|nr:hypothetical protein PVAND_014750 [Polypedilum vanderplanki]BAN67582.1 globin [Polypedilum vanderplanki]